MSLNSAPTQPKTGGEKNIFWKIVLHKFFFLVFYILLSAIAWFGWYLNTSPALRLQSISNGDFFITMFYATYSLCFFLFAQTLLTIDFIWIFPIPDILLLLWTALFLTGISHVLKKRRFARHVSIILIVWLIINCLMMFGSRNLVD